MDFLPAEFIANKRQGKTHTQIEIKSFIGQFATGKIPDYQVAAWLMAAYLNGLSSDETLWITESMLHSGEVLSFGDLDPAPVDKHSTGGVGDKTSLILAPLLAAAGGYTPMMAGRGLGHTGGTLDKLEAIPGFKVQMELEQFKSIVRKVGAAIIGQSRSICPADLKLYALRDVTATVDSIPLICASIMSKKIAEGIGGLVLDVKFGSGAFMKTKAKAQDLAQQLVYIGQKYGINTVTLLTDMNQPLGSYVGNALEVKECMDIMSNIKMVENGVELYADTLDLTLELAGNMLVLSKICPSVEEGKKVGRKLLESGKVMEKFMEMTYAQGAVTKWQLPEAKCKEEYLSPVEGQLLTMDCEQIGLAGIELGAGRKKIEDKIDPTAGFCMKVKLGQKVQKGQPLMQIYGNRSDLFPQVKKRLDNVFKIGNPLRVANE
ncbi:MAG: thymidine phosphorylase [Bdellovibrionales bacterium]|nr:thymidine phosphorylase [Bdellovibrionales bacterium]